MGVGPGKTKDGKVLTLDRVATAINEYLAEYYRAPNRFV